MNKSKNFLFGAFSVSLLVLFISVLDQPVSGAPPGPKLRRYYLTTTTHLGGQALNACAAGFHMASLWEILDTSNLEYDTVLGRTRDDSGFGPPAVANTGEFGWIRTGINSSSDFNCNNWTSSMNTSEGEGVGLPSGQAFGGPVLLSSPWVVETFDCNLSKSVWCVQD